MTNEQEKQPAPQIRLDPIFLKRFREAAEEPFELPENADSVLTEWFHDRQRSAETDSKEELLKRLFHIRNKVSGIEIESPSYEVITNPQHGRILAERHQQLNRKKTILQCVDLANHIDEEDLRQKIALNGVFIDDYDKQLMEERITERLIDPNDEGWLIVESQGQLRRKKDMTLSDKLPGGDIQILVPSVDTSALVEDLMLYRQRKTKKGKGPDRIDSSARRIWNEIQANPAAVAWISDVCSERGLSAENKDSEYFPPLRFAAVASEGAFKEIRRLNEDREIPLRWALSAVVEIIAIWSKNRKRCLKLFERPLANRSGVGLTKRRRVSKDGTVYRNVSLGKQIARMSPAVLPDGRECKLECNWCIEGQEIWKPSDGGLSPSTSVTIEVPFSGGGAEEPKQ